MAERRVAQQQHHVLRRDDAARSLAEGADQRKHRDDDGQDHHQGGGKVLARSLLTVESNNIARFFRRGELWTFNTQVATSAGFGAGGCRCAGGSCWPATRCRRDSTSPIAAALGAALEAGDLALKPGRRCCCTGARACRRRAWSSDRLRHLGRGLPPRAVSAGLGLVKTGGARHVAVALAGAEPSPRTPRRSRWQRPMPVYLYRHTKPSAPKRPRCPR